MAERRMFAKTIIDSDAFLDMPLSTQALYFHLSMRADDEGFINNPKKIQRVIGASDDDLKLLIVKNFIIPFESGIVVIKHWRIHNYIRQDRKQATVYADEMSLLEVKDNGTYIMSGICQPSVNQVSTKCQHSIGEVSIGENSIDNTESPKKTKHKYGEYNNVLLTDEELEKLKNEYPDYLDRIERLSSYVASTGKSYKSHYATIRNWVRKDAEAPKNVVDKSKANFTEREFDRDNLERELFIRSK